jgi:hypothetical protein
MHLPHVTAREDHELGLLLRWSYGSAFGLGTHLAYVTAVALTDA